MLGKKHKHSQDNIIQDKISNMRYINEEKETLYKKNSSRKKANNNNNNNNKTNKQAVPKQRY